MNMNRKTLIFKIIFALGLIVPVAMCLILRFGVDTLSKYWSVFIPTDAWGFGMGVYGAAIGFLPVCIMSMIYLSIISSDITFKSSLKSAVIVILAYAMMFVLSL